MDVRINSGRMARLLTRFFPVEKTLGTLSNRCFGRVVLILRRSNGMKRIFFICSVLVFAGSFVSAQDGYRGPGADVVTVEAAKGLRNDYPVILRGKIERFLGDEKYLFTDETGSIIVEIDNRLWRGFSADQNDTVEITGEVDKGYTKIEIEVGSIKKMP
jgi:uncharacterized protein (TIGR00156 family)